MKTRVVKKPTPSRRRVLEQISNAECELSAKDLYRALEPGGSIPLGSIYRILRELTRENLVLKRETPDGAVFRQVQAATRCDR